jgi:Fic family protein
VEAAAFSERRTGDLVKSVDGNWAFVPHALPPKGLQPDWETWTLAEQAGQSLSRLAGAGETLANPYLLIRPFMRREAISSSRIEGTHANTEQILLFEANEEEGTSDATTADPDREEVMNYILAMQKGLELIQKRPISLNLMKSLHEVLMQGVRGEDKDPGSFRRVQNCIGNPELGIAGARFVPPPVPQMSGLLDNLEKFIHIQPPEYPLLIRLALVHYQFESIHPFMDGNGRIGRLLVPLMLCAEQILPQPLLYLSAYFEVHKTRYMDLLLGVSQRGEWGEWIKFFLRGVKEQAEDALWRSRQIVDLQKNYRQRAQKGVRNSAKMLGLIDGLFINPIVSVKRAAQLGGVTVTAATNWIQALESEGILAPYGNRKWARRWVAPEIFKIMDAPRAGNEPN